MSKDLSAMWLEDDNDVIEQEETVFGTNNSSPFIQGYGAYDVKIVVAKRIVVKGSKVEFIEIDFINKENKEHREKFMVRGKDGKTFYMANGKKMQHFGVNKIKSLLKVSGLYLDSDNSMRELYSNTSEAEITFKEYGKEKTETYTVFNDLADKKVKICLTSKLENAQAKNDGDKYIKACISATEAFKAANPKKKSLAKFKPDTDYVNVYKYFTNSSIAHFCSTDGLFASEEGEGTLLKQFIDANEEGFIFDGRTLIVEDLSDSDRKRLGINQYGKIVEEDSEDDSAFVEPEEVETDDEW